MFDRFDDDARRTMARAREAAERLKHDAIGTEHLLLGVVTEMDGVAAVVLGGFDVDDAAVRREVESLVAPGDRPPSRGQLPFTRGTKRALELALDAMNDLGHARIGTEHLLIGLAALGAEDDGVAVRALHALGVTAGGLRERVKRVVDGDRATKVAAVAVRFARTEDVPAMVALSEAKRTAYERAQPAFWRKAKDSAERQRPFFASLVARPDVVALVAEGARGADGSFDVQGFLLGSIAKAPPVYDPGGLVMSVDDFAVARPGAWDDAGRALLDRARRVARERGAMLSIVVCGHHDAAKRWMLEGEGLSIASSWYVGNV